jgi:hypothetical protein
MSQYSLASWTSLVGVLIALSTLAIADDVDHWAVADDIDRVQSKDHAQTQPHLKSPSKQIEVSLDPTDDTVANANQPAVDMGGRPRTRPSVLNLSGPPPVVISRPGIYVLDRNWEVPSGGGVEPVIKILADDVVLDMRGFTIHTFNQAGVIGVTGNRVTLRDGVLGLESAGDASFAIRSTGSETVIERIRTLSEEGISIHGPSSTVRDCSVTFSTIGGDGSTITGSNVTDSLFVAANNVVVRDNIIDNGESLEILRIVGNSNEVVGNSLRNTAFFDQQGLNVVGASNLIADNIFRSLGHDVQPAAYAIRVDGAANIIRGNLAAPNQVTSEKWMTGIKFLRDGNFFGNNQMSAAVPFDLGGTAQTNWGGNVGF